MVNSFFYHIEAFDETFHNECGILKSLKFTTSDLYGFLLPSHGQRSFQQALGVKHSTTLHSFIDRFKNLAHSIIICFILFQFFSTFVIDIESVEGWSHATTNCF